MLTIGHGTLSAPEFADLLDRAGVRSLVDIRAFPGSRRHPHMSREAMASWVPEAGVAYGWEPRLGGRRRPASDSPNVALRNLAFRAYADHMATDEFRAGLAEVLATAETSRTAIMCAETLWWRCHRRLVSDAAALLAGAEVLHVMHDGGLTPHVLTDGVRRSGTTLVYDVGAERPLPL
ncbi:MAG TPA: DUF488 domain-containing protein [Acidimicrobiales bacterium]